LNIFMGCRNGYGRCEERAADGAGRRPLSLAVAYACFPKPVDRFSDR